LVDHGAKAPGTTCYGMATKTKAATAPAQTNAGKSGAPSLGASQVFHNGITSQQLDDLLASSLSDPAAEPTEQPVPVMEDQVPAEVPETPEPEPAAEPQEEEATGEDIEEEILATKPEAETEDDASQPDWVKKRLAKMTRQRRDAEERAERAESQIAELQNELDSLKLSGGQANWVPMDNVFTEEDLEAEKARAEDVIDWCNRNPSGVVVDDREYTSEDVEAIKARASWVLRHGVRERAKWIRKNKAFEPELDKVFPWWNDRSSPVRHAAEEVLKIAPVLRQVPGFRLFIGDYLLGRHTRMKRLQELEQGKAKAASALKPAPAQPAAPSSRPAQVERSAAAKTAALKRLANTGKEADLVALLSIGE
jgi:hypothetical protein